MVTIRTFYPLLQFFGSFLPPPSADFKFLAGFIPSPAASPDRVPGKLSPPGKGMNHLPNQRILFPRGQGLGMMAHRPG